MRILLAVDGSAASLHARDLVASLAWPQGSTIRLISTYDPPIGWFTPGPMTADWLASTDEALRRQAEDALAAMATPFSDRGWLVDRQVVAGRAATEILSAADGLHADLIVVGSRGRGPIRSMLLGSVSAEVADQARCSVLVARGPRASRLLVTTDGSECSATVGHVVTAWGVFRGLEAVVLSVAPVDSPTFEMMVSLYTMGSESIAGRREELLARHRGYAVDLARTLTDGGIPAAANLQAGDAAHEILRAAGQRDTDLIVTGSRCLHGLDRWLLGSVSRNVLVHADASVLVVRPTHHAPTS